MVIWGSWSILSPSSPMCRVNCLCSVSTADWEILCLASLALIRRLFVVLSVSLGDLGGFGSETTPSDSMYGVFRGGVCGVTSDFPLVLWSGSVALPADFRGGRLFVLPARQRQGQWGKCIGFEF